MNTSTLQGKKILLTGASGGIGFALTKHLAESGAHVLACGRNQLRLQKLSAAVPGVLIAWLMSDFTKPGAVEAIFDWIETHWDGELDALIHNAATPINSATVDALSMKDIDDSFTVGPVSALHLIREAARRMRRGSRIILTSSGAGHNGFASMSSYCGSKFALEGICQSAAEDLWKSGVTINTVALPSVKTEFSKAHFTPEEYEHFPEPEQVLEPFIHLLSDRASRFTGRSIFLHEHILAEESTLPPIRKYRCLQTPLLPETRPDLLEQGYAPDMAKVDLGEAPFPPSPRVAEAVTRWMQGPHTQEYPDPKCRHLRERLAERHGLTPDHILPGPGSSEILGWILDQCVDPGSDTLAGNYCFRIWSWMVQTRGIRLLTYENKKTTHDLMQVFSRITPQTRLIYIDSPSNPMGDVIQADTFRWFMDRLPPHIWVLVDHAYQDFVVDSDGLDTTTSEWLQHPRLLSVRTLSKSHAMAAWRIGYLAAHPETIRAIQGSVIPFSLSEPAQIAAIAALDDHEYTARLMEHYLTERRRIRARLDELGIPYWLGETSFNAVYWPNVSSIYKKATAENIAIPHPDNDLFFIAAIRDTESNNRVLRFLETHYPAEHRAPAS